MKIALTIYTLFLLILRSEGQDLELKLDSPKENMRVAWIDTPYEMNIDFMNMGYFYAYEKNKMTIAKFIENNASYDSASKIKLKKYNFSKQFQLLIDPNNKTRWNGYKGIKLFVINTTADTIYFDAQDHRLYLKLQAKNEDGGWNDIEYLLNSDCGNSYFTISLEPNTLWEFNVPVYYGKLKTKIRAELIYKNNEQGNVPVYSNEIDGFINSGQFWNKQEHYSNRLMDPHHH